jgi:hypothetical protein
MANARSPPPLDPETELISTEESYVKDLEVLVNTFVLPLEKWLSTLTFSKGRQIPDFCMDSIVLESNCNVIDVLFSNIKVILQCNRLLLDGLHAADKTNIQGAVLNSFVKHAPYLKLYSQYTKNYQKAVDLLTQLRQDARFI